MDVILARDKVDATGQHDVIVVYGGQSLRIGISAPAIANRLATQGLADEAASLNWIIAKHCYRAWGIDPGTIALKAGSEADIPVMTPAKTARQTLAEALATANTVAGIRAALLAFAQAKD